MRHKRRRGRLGLVQEHRRALLRNLAKALIVNQRIVTTHVRAKETSKFVDQLITVAKQKTLHARRVLIGRLGSGSEQLVKRLIDLVAPAFENRHGGYTRVIRYKNRVGDGAQLSLLEFTVPVESVEKKSKKKKEKKQLAKEADKKSEPAHPEKHKTEEKPKEKEAKKEKEADKKEAPKKGGFLGTLRKFLKGE